MERGALKTFFFVLDILLSLGLAALCGYAVCSPYRGEMLVRSVAAFAACLLLLSYFADIWHEMGHKFFGLVCKTGVRVKSIKPFASSRSCTVFPKTDRNIKARFLATAGGGLVFNFIFIVLGAVALAFEKSALFGCVLPMSFYLFFLNALPFEYGGGKTDGLVILEVLRGEDTAKVLLNILTVQGQVNAGKPLREIDKSLLFDVPQLREDDANFLALTELRYEYCKACGDGPNAQKYLERYRELKEQY